MTRLGMDELGWRPVDHETGDGESRVTAGETVLALRWPRLVVAAPEEQSHIAQWRLIPGGSLADRTDEEAGLRAGYFETDLDDTTWYAASRVNEVGFGFPTWEGESYAGYLWYRTRIARPAGNGPLAVTLGSPLERRRLAWRVFADGAEVTARPVEAGMVTVDLPDGDDDLLIAVQLRVEPVFGADRVREREGWRSVDKYCYQTVHRAGAFTVLDAVDAVRDADRLTLTYPGGVTATVTYEATDDLVRQRLTLAGDGPWISQVLLAEQAVDGADYHAEGAWALWGRHFQAATHPAAVTYRGESGPVSAFWPGRRIGAGRELSAPDVVVGIGPTDSGEANVRAVFERIGRERTPYRIYDPYGWYQISHANEPKIELSDAMMGDIDSLVDRLAGAGATFDAISLDCGWNDPDDLARFNPATFADGPASVQATVKRHGLDLILWVSPSDGARAFRHEIGLHNPGVEAALAGNAAFPWRLCPAAEPWRAQFRDALLHHVTVTGATGFKVDGTELWCVNPAHDHASGIHSLYATTEALIDTFEAVIAAGGPFLMLYWGLRSPWWLRYGATLWERDYLVEAAGPSGVPAWNVRLGVASSQDVGQQSYWSTIPAHQQDSLGVWISTTLWASRQGAAQWEDGQVLDVARGSLLNQVWGDLRMAGDDRLAAQFALEERRRPELTGSGRPVGRAWIDEAYGYAWSSDAGTWVVLSRPGATGTVELEVPAGRRGVHLDYVTEGATARATLDGGVLRVAQSGGSVAAFYLSTEDGPASAGEEPFVPSTYSWTRTAQRRDAPDENRVKAAYLGRAPQIATWMKGENPDELTLERILPCVPAVDRTLETVERQWSGEVEVDTDRRCAVVTSAVRDGAAWHHDRLHELVDVRLEVDGTPVEPDRWPDFHHEQAGSWSSVVDTFTLPAGRHTVRATVRTLLPDTVGSVTQLWVR
ncbi:hypothetical protein [Asanoa iriomotensis]|uniref:Alpha-galactosidase n=1 Tax=Asanoa iriomotensis TaxID=234613 RepID=A0ABQ4BZ66_9ACTN|nr:hypothetical protein [Asanoa iriomotensis]GIF55821.1 hypothetical protein Air01nite_19160 [Asanoa iriomotensis]